MNQHQHGLAGAACGKAILLGEHAVVHNKPALAVGIPLGVRVVAEPSAGSLALAVSPWGLMTTVGDGTRVGEALAALTAALGMTGDGLKLVAEASLPPGAGLGSSAALAAAAARALAASCSIELDDVKLFSAVQAAERIFHGNPSGLDAAVAIHGGVLRYDRKQGIKQLAVEAPPLVAIHSGTTGNTREMVAHFANRLAEHPREGGRRLARIANLVESGIAAIESEALRELGLAMTECHEHLAWFGVSTEELDRICQIALQAGALGAKLTGGGGGGCAIALVEPGNRKPVAEAIADAGFQPVWQ